MKFHHSKLNFKAARGGEEVKWHQDIQFWPHTNYDLLTVGVFLEDVEPGMGEVGFVPGSHDGPLYDLYDGDDLGRRARRRRRRRPPASTRACTRPARRGRSRCTTAARCTVRRRTGRTGPARCCCRPTPPADAYPYTDLVRRSPHGEELIRGEPARWARHDPRPCLMPPSGPVPADLRGPAARGLTVQLSRGSTARRTGATVATGSVVKKLTMIVLQSSGFSCRRKWDVPGTIASSELAIPR